MEASLICLVYWWAPLDPFLTPESPCVVSAHRADALLMWQLRAQE